VVFAVIAVNYGLDQQDRFEVLIISINWLVLLINGPLTSAPFRGSGVAVRRLQPSTERMRHGTHP
jgi:hypothetical protein